MYLTVFVSLTVCMMLLKHVNVFDINKHFVSFQKKRKKKKKSQKCSIQFFMSLLF